MALVDAGRRDEALALLGQQGPLGDRLGKVSSDWIGYNELLAAKAGRAALDAMRQSRWKMLFAVGVGLVLASGLGWLTYRGIVDPIRALQTSVEAVARGDYAQAVPFTKATDETGGLGPVGGNPEAGRGGDGGAALGQIQRRQTHRRIAGCELAGRVWATAGLRPGADAGGRRRGVLCVRRRTRGAFGASPATAWRKAPRRRTRSAWARAWSASARGSASPSSWPTCRRTICGSPPASGAAAPIQAVAWPLLSQDTLLGVTRVRLVPLVQSQNEKALLDGIAAGGGDEPGDPASAICARRNCSQQDRGHARSARASSSNPAPRASSARTPRDASAS